MKRKVKILFLAANPEDRVGLELNREYRRIREALLRGKFRDSFQLLEPEMAARIQDLTSALTKHQPHVIHFCGHGSKDRGIAFEREDGYSRPADVAELTNLFETLNHDARLIFLNACHTREQAEALRQIFDYTVGTNGLILDTLAGEFAGWFYKALADGTTVTGAFQSAQATVNGRVKGISELLKRDGADDTGPFFLQVLGRRGYGGVSPTDNSREDKNTTPPSGEIIFNNSTARDIYNVRRGNVRVENHESSHRQGTKKRDKR
jgi:hypothetical protein